MRKGFLSKVAALAMAATMMMGMSVSALAAEGDVYAKFCKDGKGPDSISMTQMAIDGPATVVENEDEETVTITLPLDGFQYEKMGIKADGYLNTLTLGPGTNNTATAVYGADTDNDGYQNGTITFTIPESRYSVDTGAYIDSNVKANLSLLSGVFEQEMTSDVDLYFTHTQPVYSE